MPAYQTCRLGVQQGLASASRTWGFRVIGRSLHISEIQLGLSCSSPMPTQARLGSELKYTRTARRSHRQRQDLSSAVAKASHPLTESSDTKSESCCLTRSRLYMHFSSAISPRFVQFQDSSRRWTSNAVQESISRPHHGIQC